MKSHSVNTSVVSHKIIENNVSQNALNGEAEARANADATLQSNIDAEESARQTADSTLQYNIDAEATTRANGDKQKTAGVVVRPTITRNGNGTVTVGSDGVYALYTEDVPSVIGQFSCTGGTFTLTEGSTHYLLARYSNGSASLLWTTDRSQVEGNFRTVIPIETLYLFGGEIHGDSWDEAGHALAEKMLNRLINTSRYVRDEIDGGLALGELTGRVVTISSGAVWRGVEKTQLAEFNSSSSGRLLLHVWNGTSWTVSQVTQYDNSNYQGASGLVAIQNTNRYAVNWLFRTGGDDADCVLVLGTGDYTLDQALASGVPANLPALATKHGFLVGRIIVAKGAASAYRIESAFTTSFQSGVVLDHGALSNLQGGTIGEYYHQSYAQWLRNQSPNTANNVAVVGNDGKLLPTLMPDIAVVDFLGEVSSQSAMLALVGQKGDWCTRTDLGTNWQVVGNDSSQLASWRQLTYPQSPVNSVFGETGAITAKAAHYASFYLGLSAQAADSAMLGGQLPSYYSVNGHTHSYAGSANAGGAAVSAVVLDPLSGNADFKLAFAADGTRTDPGVYGRVVMRYAVNGKTFGVQVDRADTVSDSDYYRIAHPGGGAYVSQTGQQVGAIAVRLPVGMTSTMVRVAVKVFDYVTGNSFECHVCGYPYPEGNTWQYSPTAYIIGNPNTDRRFTVRLGYDPTAGKAMIYIGELSSIWDFPQVYVTEVLCGFGGCSEAWTSGWQIGFESVAFKNVTATITDCQVGFKTPNLTAIENLAGTAGVPVKTSANTWELKSGTTAAVVIGGTTLNFQNGVLMSVSP